MTRVSPLILVALLVPAAALAQVRPGNGGTFGQRSTPADDALYFHVLQRTSFGPTSESMARIRAMGVDAYLWEQLHPETIDDSAVEARLASELPPTSDVTYRWAEMNYAYLVRASDSKRQLQAVMTQFWENHFDTSIEHGNDDAQAHEWAMMEQTEDDALRAGALGTFRDLLEVSAKSQAMMWFLDNYQNNVRSNNENYARELMELHTLGVDCGYDQFDVEQVARIFTGWSGQSQFMTRHSADPCDQPGEIDYRWPGVNCAVDDCCTIDVDPCDEPGETPGKDCDSNQYTEPNGFFFNNTAHDNLPKPNPSDPSNPRGTVLGTTFPAGGGLAEGERVLDILAGHACTARFISSKLIKLFVMDEPSDEYVDRIAARFLETGGDMREVLWAIFKSPEFRDPAYFGGKVKTPMELCLSALRGVEGRMTPRSGGWSLYDAPTMWNFVALQGQDLFAFAIPTGYPEVAEPWVSANGFLNRWRYADDLMFLTPGNPWQLESDPLAVANRLRLSNADAVIDHYSRLLLGITLDPARRQILHDLLVNPRTGLYDPADGGQTWRLREMVSNMIGFPEFNKQ